MNNHVKCFNCRYWTMPEAEPDAYVGNLHGECSRYPAYQLVEDLVIGTNARTVPSMLCDQFRPRR